LASAPKVDTPGLFEGLGIAVLPASRAFGRNSLWWLALALCGLCLLPVLQVGSALFSPAPEVWAHVGPLLPGLLVNTLELVLGVVIGTGVLGVGLAWLTALHEFPGRTLLSWALMLPLAVPAYVLGFVLVALFDYSGPVPTVWRLWFGPDAWFPSVRSTGGVILALTLALYPYVYLLARNAFMTQSARTVEAARSLGLGRAGAFWRVTLPMARPWIGTGLLLVAMETLADFGVVSVFNYETFTTAIYKAWFGLFSLPAAAQLASFLILFALTALAAEQALRARQRYYLCARGGAGLPVRRLTGWRGALALVAAVSVLLPAFLLPMAELVVWSALVFLRDADARFLGYCLNTLSLAGAGAGSIVLAALLLSLVKRRWPDARTRIMVRLATLGYALPGTVLAVGVFLPLAWFDNVWIDLARAAWGFEPAPLFGGGLLALLIAYLIRFLAAGFGAVDSAMERVTPRMEDAARGLRVSGWRLLRRVYAPLLRGGLSTGFLLALVDIMKEMPITLLMRPFGWDTLAVRIFEMTSEGEWQRAALPSVVLVLAGLIPIVSLMRASERHP
jgi:iron(III) transport system permease protein